MNLIRPQQNRAHIQSHVLAVKKLPNKELLDWPLIVRPRQLAPSVFSRNKSKIDPHQPKTKLAHN